MSYCRFQNTYKDLLDCYKSMAEEEPLSEVEQNYRAKLVRLANLIVIDYGDEQQQMKDAIALLKAEGYQISHPHGA